MARLDQAMDGGEDNPTLSLFEQSLDSGGDDFQKLVQSLGEAYGNGRWQGDRDSWPEAIDDAHWRKLTVDHRQCTNRRCGHFGACAFFRARRDLDSADIIVANHDLVLADLALGGGVVLPDPGDCLYVFDEGHHLPDKALNHFTHRFAVGGGLRWLRTLKKSLTELNQQLGVQPTLARLLSGLPQAIERSSRTSARSSRWDISLPAGRKGSASPRRAPSIASRWGVFPTPCARHPVPGDDLR